jgi:hypothetical protein
MVGSGCDVADRERWEKVHTSYALLGTRSAFDTKRSGYRLGVLPVGPPLALATGP